MENIKKNDVFYVDECIYIVRDKQGECLHCWGRDKHHTDWVEVTTHRSVCERGQKLEPRMAEVWVRALEEYETFKEEVKQKYDRMMLQHEKLRVVFQTVYENLPSSKDKEQ